MPKNNLNMMKHINLEVLKERVEQNKKWGEQNHSMTEWLAILVEEVGEAAQAINRLNFPECAKETDADNLCDELIQISAVASAMAEQVLEQG